jgi:outer membrane lipoprotein-sorting protein
MKKGFFLTLFILFTFSLSFGQELSGKDIIDKVNDLMNVSTSYAKSKMTITTTSGQQRTFTSESWSKDRGEKNLVRYIEPARIKGQAFLMLNNANDIWVYNPRTQRVRKLATHAKKQKVEGSDFSYEDMGGGDAFIEDYTPVRLKDERKEGYDCYTVELTRKADSEASYTKLLLWVIKDNNVPVVIDYYDENAPDRVLKTLVQSDFKIIDDIPTAMKVVMTDRNEDSQTIMEILDMKFNIELDDSMFTERELKK